MTPAGRTIVPKVVALGRGTTEAVSKERLRFYEWLVGLLIGPADAPAEAQSVSMGMEAIQGAASSIRLLLEDVGEPATSVEQVLLVDFSVSNPIHLRQLLLYETAETLGRLLAGRSDRHAVILLPVIGDQAEVEPQLGNQVSALRGSLVGLPGSPVAGSVIVIDGEGNQWRLSATGEFDEVPDQPSPSDYLQQARSLSESLEDRLRRKVLRRLGHYQFGSVQDGHCTRYFLDAALAVNEVVELVLDHIDRENLGPSLAVIYSHQRYSPWLTEAAVLVAEKLGKQHVPLVAAAEVSVEHVVDGPGLLMLDLVSTAETAKSLVAALRRNGAALHSSIISVFGEKDSTFQVDGAWVATRAIHRVDRKQASRTNCPQCRERLPRTKFDGDTTTQIRAFDMWTMLLEYEWVKEEYGPGGTMPIPEVPDFARIFAEFGGWVAYKIDNLIRRHLGVVPEEVVFVVPDEPGMRALTHVLKTWRDGRPVSVAVPRSILDELAQKDEEAIIVSSASGWRRQLAELSDHAAVYMLDEFNGSGTTASAMYRLLRLVGAKPKAYVPILNRNPHFSLPNSVPIFPLYEIPRPRRSK